MSLETVLMIIGSLGGLELIRWAWSAWRYRKQEKKRTEAEATVAEFGALREQLQLMEEFNRDKEQRFVEQDKRLQGLVEDMFKMKVEMNDLQLRYNELQERYNKLQERYNELQERYNKMRSKK